MTVDETDVDGNRWNYDSRVERDRRRQSHNGIRPIAPTLYVSRPAVNGTSSNDRPRREQQSARPQRTEATGNEPGNGNRKSPRRVAAMATAAAASASISNAPPVASRPRCPSSRILAAPSTAAIATTPCVPKALPEPVAAPTAEANRRNLARHNPPNCDSSLCHQRPRNTSGAAFISAMLRIVTTSPAGPIANRERFCACYARDFNLEAVRRSGWLVRRSES